MCHLREACSVLSSKGESSHLSWGAGDQVRNGPSAELTLNAPNKGASMVIRWSEMPGEEVDVGKTFQVEKILGFILLMEKGVLNILLGEGMSHMIRLAF